MFYIFSSVGAIPMTLRLTFSSTLYIIFTNKQLETTVTSKFGAMAMTKVVKDSLFLTIFLRLNKVRNCSVKNFAFHIFL